MNRYIYPYDININLREAQNNLANQVIEEDLEINPQIVAGVDVSFSKNNRAVAAAVSIDLKNLKVREQKTLLVELHFPYVPGFLGFREADAMVSVLKELKNGFDVVMVNGHGVLHPRRFGLASHVGLLMGKPSIGFAKRLTSGVYEIHITALNGEQSNIKPVVSNGRMVGGYFNGNYISVGHRISLQRAVKIVQKTSKFRKPEPIRQAHILASEECKKLLKQYKLKK